LYRPKPRTTSRCGRPVPAGMTCSSVVNGPDSITSTDSAPLIATTTSCHRGAPNVIVIPAQTNAAYRAP
jgi:hypothetical protein